MSSQCLAGPSTSSTYRLLCNPHLASPIHIKYIACIGAKNGTVLSFQIWLVRLVNGLSVSLSVVSFASLSCHCCI